MIITHRWANFELSDLVWLETSSLDWKTRRPTRFYHRPKSEGIHEVPSSNIFTQHLSFHMNCWSYQIHWTLKWPGWQNEPFGKCAFRNRPASLWITNRATCGWWRCPCSSSLPSTPSSSSGSSRSAIFSFIMNHDSEAANRAMDHLN